MPLDNKMLRTLYLVNETQRKYLNVGAYYPRDIARILTRLEQYKWDLRTDCIYIHHTETPPVGYELADIIF